MLILSLLSPALALSIILFFCIKNCKEKVTKDLKPFAIPLGMAFGTLGYSFRFAYSSNDLLTYFSQIDAMSPYSFGEIIAKNSDGLYVKDGLFFFVNRCANNYILPFLVGFVIYSIVFYVLFDMVKRSERVYSYWEILLLGLIAVGILAPYTVILNTRCVLAYTLIAFATYRDAIQKKRNFLTLLLYVAPIAIHSSAVIIILIRLLGLFLQKFEKAKWSVLSIAIFLPTIIDFFHSNVSNLLSGTIGSIISGAFEKAYWYLHWTSGGWATQVENSLNSKMIKIFGTIFVTMIIYLILKRETSKASIQQNSLFRKPMISFLFLVSVFALGCLHIKTGAFWRFEAIVVLFSPVILVQAIDDGFLKKKHLQIIAMLITIPLLYNIAYQVANLRIIETMTSYVATSGVKIIVELIRGVIHLIG